MQRFFFFDCCSFFHSFLPYAIQEVEGRGERDRFLCEDREYKKMEITPIFYFYLFTSFSTSYHKDD